MSSDKKTQKGMTRRDFFMGAAVAGVTLAGADTLSGVAQASSSDGHNNQEDVYEPIPLPVNGVEVICNSHKNVERRK
jgi:hypothetical protein